MKLVKYLFVAALALNLCCLTGCGSRDKAYTKISGTVMMDGAPLADCVLTFYAQSPDGENGSGKTDAQGNFTATSQGAENGGTGLKPGEYKVTAMKNSSVVDEDQEAYNNGTITYDELQERKAKKGAYAKSSSSELLTPRRYLDENSTPLSITVTKDAKSNVFELVIE